jgi:hypothetical protein
MDEFDLDIRLGEAIVTAVSAYPTTEDATQCASCKVTCAN